MLSKMGIKDNKGINKISIILIVAIAVAVIIAGILLFVVINNNKQTQPAQVNENQNLQDTNNEIDLAEKNKLKDEYLGIFSLLVSNKYQTEDENLIEAANQIVKKAEANNPETTTSSALSRTNNSQTEEEQTNTIENTVAEPTQTMVNDTIVITGQNPLYPNTNTTNTNTTATTTTNTNTTATTTTDTTTTNTNTTAGDTNSVSTTINSNLNTNQPVLDEEKIETAISEINGGNIENLNTILSSWNETKKVTPGYVTDIVSISKSNGVYDIIYNVCWPKETELIKYAQIEKINTGAIDKLDRTMIEAKLIKNTNYNYSEYKVLSIEEIETKTPNSYYLTYDSGKVGVIDQTGKIVLQSAYDMVDIPNNYKDIFICRTGDTSVVLNSENEVLFEDYKNISAILSTDGAKYWYEKDFLVYEKDGKYGAIDYDGFEIFEPIYDKIEPLYYIEGYVVLTENGRQALADITGSLRGNFKYTKIGVLGGQFTLDSMVDSSRTLEQVQEMVATAVYIVGEDVNGKVETIRKITPEEYAEGRSEILQMNYEASINEWQLRLLDNAYYVYIKE